MNENTLLTHPLVVLDIETTGTDKERDVILEIYAGELASLFDIRIVNEFHQIAFYDKDFFSTARLDKKVLEMHDLNGLWSDCYCSSLSEEKVLKNFYNWIVEIFERTGKKIVLVGNSVGSFDHSFLEARYPDLSKYLHHHTLDVSGFHRLARALRPAKFKNPSTNKFHRAPDDVKYDTIPLLKELIKKIG